VLPFARFAGADSVLGPEMKSTGEVMGIRRRLPDRVRQGAGAAGVVLPESGSVFMHVNRFRQARRNPAGGALPRLGFEVIGDRRHRPGDLADGGAGDPDQQDRRGLAARRRPDPPAPLRTW